MEGACFKYLMVGGQVHPGKVRNSQMTGKGNYSVMKKPGRVLFLKTLLIASVRLLTWSFS
jgi:hypothetical protein